MNSGLYRELAKRCAGSLKMQKGSWSTIELLIRDDLHGVTEPFRHFQRTTWTFSENHYDSSAGLRIGMTQPPCMIIVTRRLHSTRLALDPHETTQDSSITKHTVVD